MACKYPYDNCRCYARMGNDFWFLPADRCLDDAGPPVLGVAQDNDKQGQRHVSQDHERGKRA